MARDNGFRTPRGRQGAASSSLPANSAHPAYTRPPRGRSFASDFAIPLNEPVIDMDAIMRDMERVTRALESRSRPRISARSLKEDLFGTSLGCDYTLVTLLGDSFEDAALVHHAASLPGSIVVVGPDFKASRIDPRYTIIDHIPTLVLED